MKDIQKEVSILQFTQFLVNPFHSVARMTNIELSRSLLCWLGDQDSIFINAPLESLSDLWLALNLHGGELAHLPNSVDMVLSRVLSCHLNWS